MHGSFRLCQEGPITQAEYESEAVRELRMRMNNVACWMNDVQSLPMELNQPGQYHNMVTLFAREGYSLQAASDHTVECVKGEIRSFEDLAAKTIRSASPQLQEYIQGLTHWMRGYQDWVMQDTGRYKNLYISSDSDDRGISLAV